MRLYHHYVFPYLLEAVMSNRRLDAPRERTLAPARGRILEIGFGTGCNLPHYPANVRRIEAIEPDIDLDRHSRRRIARAPIEVDFHHLDAEHLPFKARRYDTVVSTFTLCSIPDVEHALAEIRRVLKPGGRFLFLEHGRSPEPGVAQWQDRLDAAWRSLAGGCHLNRPMRDLVAASGLVLGPVRSYYLERVPRFAGWFTEGVAQR